MVLNVIDNKKQVIALICDRLNGTSFPKDQKVIVTGLNPQPIELGLGPQIIELRHEEADVSIVYHLLHEASQGNSPITVLSEDTDVLVLLLHHVHALNCNLPSTIEVRMQSLSSGRSIIDVNKTIQQHAAIIPNLLAAHAITGCDTVSSISGIGKSTVLKKLKNFKEELKLGDANSSFDAILKSTCKFVTTLYGRNPDDDWSTLRATIFARKMAGKQHVVPKLCSLPPTLAAFKLHCQRAHFQTATWKSAGMPDPPSMDPLQYGWDVDGDLLRATVLPSETLIAPDELLKLVCCNCTTACKSALCSCSKSRMSCTEFCKCKGEESCLNPLTISPTLQDSDADEVEQQDDDECESDVM